MTLLSIGGMGPPKIVNQICLLAGIPPAEPIDIAAGMNQRLPGLFDLDLKSPVGQKKWVGMIKENFQPPQSRDKGSRLSP